MIFPKHFKSILTISTITIGVFFPSSLHAQQPTRIQVFVTSSEAKANATVNQLNSMETGPAKVIPSGGLYKVVTRVYPSLADANFAKSKIAGRGFPDAFAVAEPSTVKFDSTISATSVKDVPSVASLGSFNNEVFDFVITQSQAAPTRVLDTTIRSVSNADATETQLFGKAMSYGGNAAQAPEAVQTLKSFQKRFPASSHIGEVRLKEAYWHVSAGDVPAAKAAFEAIAADMQKSPAAGEATLRLAYLAIKDNNYEKAAALLNSVASDAVPSDDETKADAVMRLGYVQIHQKDFASALRKFHDVASGKVPSSGAVQLEAILRTAALYHRGKDLKSADTCYQVLISLSNDPDLNAFAELHRAGLTMEMAWNGKATFDQARGMCDQLLANHSNAPKSIRATAALMALETLAYENRYDDMMKRESAAMTEMADTTEASLGYYWIAKAHMQTGDAQGAVDILKTVIDSPVSTRERFKNVDLTPQARQLASKAYEKLGDSAKAQAVLQKN